MQPIAPVARCGTRVSSVASGEQANRTGAYGDVPSPANPPSGCVFRTRCWKAQDKCALEVPVLENRGFDHLTACHFAEVRHIVETVD